MKNGLFLLLLTLTVLIVSTTAYAATKDCAPGCDCSTGADGKGVLGQMERHGDAVRTRDKAYSQQIFKQPDNTLGMTCFDRGIAVSSRLGQIFSDKINDGAGAMNSAVFGNSTYANMGMDKMLATTLSGIVADQLESHVKNFLPTSVSSGSLSSVLGATNLSFMRGYANDLQHDINDIVNGPMKSVDQAASLLNTIMKTVNTAMPLLKVMPPTTVTTTISVIQGALNSIQGIVGKAMSVAMQAVTKLYKNLIGKVMGQANSMASKPCNRLNELWSGKGAPSNFKPAVGSGIEKGVPYFAISQLLKGKVPSGGGTDFIQGILNNTGKANSPLDKALKDLTGPLSGPGKSETWRTPPIFTSGMSTTDIIEMMGTK